MRSFHDLEKRELQNNGGTYQNKASSSTKQSITKDDEIEKLKKVNMGLLSEIKQLKIEL